MSARARDFVLLGYFLKHVAKPDRRFPLAENAEEICSVSNCISEAPKGWMDKWLHNGYFFYDSEAVARAFAAKLGNIDVVAGEKLDALRVFGADAELTITASGKAWFNK